MVGTRWRLTYTDSGGTKRTIAELGQDTGANKIDRIRYILKQKNPWILKVFTDPEVLNNIPQELTEFEGSEPEILFEEYENGSWTTRGRFYNASETNEENEYAIQFMDFYHKVMNQEASVSSTTTNIVDVLEKALPNGYVVDAPSSTDVGGYPSVDDYSANNTQVRKVYREITRDNDWSLFFLPEQDGSGNWKVRFEPDGFGGSVDILDTSTDQDLKIKQYQPPRKRNLVTKALAEGVNKNGNTVSATAENTTIRDKYLGTKASDHNFKKVKRSYFQSQTEAQSAAESALVPGPDATKVKEKIKTSTTVYPQDVVNDSFNILDDFRSIDDTFTCVKQENFYPANQSLLHFEFESEQLEQAAEGEENLRDERERLYPESTQQKTVGPLDIDENATDTENVEEQYDADSQNNHPHGNSNTTSEVGQIGTEGQQTADELFFSIADGGSNTVTANDVSYSGNQFVVDYVLDTDAGYGAEFIIQVSLAGSGTILQSYVTKTNNGGNIENIFTDLRNANGEDIEFLVVNKSGTSVSVNSQSVTFVGEAPHDHFVNIAPTDGNTADLTINVNSSDSSAGDTSQLTVSGQTLDELIDILTTVENNTSR